MPITSSLTADAIRVALRAYLLTILPAPIEIIRGQANKVPLPKTPNYVVLTPLLRSRLATNVDIYDFAAVAPTASTATASTQFSVQCDVYGPGAEDNCQIITTLFRDQNACAALEPLGIAPLYTGEARQMAFVNAEAAYEDRWSIDLHMQISPTLTIPTQFADAVTAGVISVEAEYGPHP